MKRTQDNIANRIKIRQRQKRWRTVALFMSVIVFLSVAWQLAIPVLTMTPDIACGYEEHVHTESCYSELLVCTEAHEHSDDCYRTVLSCGKPEHSHDSSCYTKENSYTDEDLQTVSQLVSEDTSNVVSINFAVNGEEQIYLLQRGDVLQNAIGMDGTAISEIPTNYYRNGAYIIGWSTGYGFVSWDTVVDDNMVVTPVYGYSVDLYEGNTLVQSMIVEADMQLGQVLPAPSLAEGETFLGWFFVGNDGNPQKLESDTIIGGNTMAVANIQKPEEIEDAQTSEEKSVQDTAKETVGDKLEEEIQIMGLLEDEEVLLGDGSDGHIPTIAVYFHEINPDGSEASSFVVNYNNGETLESGISKNSMSDGSFANSRIWHNGQNGPEFAMSDTVTWPEGSENEIHLYTYNYKLEMQLSGKSSYSIMVPEGQAIPERQFVNDGTDYLESSWYDESNNSVNLRTLAANGLTENVTVHATAPSSSRIMVNFYAVIGDEWTNIASNSMDLQMIRYPGNNTNYYAISANALEAAYQEFGFTADQLTEGIRIFRHSRTTETRMWGDRGAFEYNGEMYVPLMDVTDPVNIYYLPKDETNTEDYIDMSNADARSRNAHKTITIYHTEDKSDAPDLRYFLPGDNVNVALERLTGNRRWERSDRESLGMRSIGDIIASDANTYTYRLGFNGNAAYAPKDDIEMYPVSFSDTTPRSVTFMVSIDEVWTEITTEDCNVELKTLLYTAPGFGTQSMRETYALPVEKIAEVYADFGFTEDDLVIGQTQFPKSAPSDNGNLWNDYPAFEDEDGNKYVSVHNSAWDSGSVKLYYMPVTTGTLIPANYNINPNGANNEGNKNNVQNTFYSVTVQNPENIGLVSNDLPPVSYHLRGTTATITVPNLTQEEIDNGYQWTANGVAMTNAVDNGDGTTTFTIPYISGKTVIEPGEPRESGKKVRFWVSIDGQWVQVGDDAQSVPVETINYTDVNNYRNNEVGVTALSAKTVAEVYKDFGITEDQIVPGCNLFRTGTDGSGDKVLNGDKDVTPYAGNNYVYLKENAAWNVADVYLTPADATKGRDEVNANGEYSDGSSVVEENSYYTVTIQDPAGISGMDDLPQVQYVRRGDNVRLTVKDLSDGKHWVIIPNQPSSLYSSGGYSYIGFNNVQNSITVQPENEDGEFTVRYKIFPDGTQLTKDYADANTQQVWDTNSLPYVNGVRDLSVMVDTNESGWEHEVLSPSVPYAQSYKNFSVAGGNKGFQYYTYTFDGWTIEGHEDVKIEPGTKLTKEQLEQYADDGNQVILKPRWNLGSKDNENPINSVGFYVRIDSTINDKSIDLNNDAQYTYNYKYSDCVYSTAVINGENVHEEVYQDGNNQRFIWPTDDALTGIPADTEIRKLATEGYDGWDAVHGEAVNVKLASFPSDEEVLARLRTWQERDYSYNNISSNLSIDGEPIPYEMLTTKNFAIRWYVFKYDDSNGYHIDGLLVPKKGHLTITKNFTGDVDAIAEAKRNFEITVTPDREGEEVQYLTLDGHNVNGKASVKPRIMNDDGTYTEVGAYDASTDTYTWVLDVNQLTQYTVTESRATFTGDLANIEEYAEYRVVNSDNASENTINQPGNENGWMRYDENGAEVTGYAYYTDLNYRGYQAVHLHNDYRRNGSLVLRKVDQTGEVVPGAVFTLSGTTSLDVYKMDGEYYIGRPSGGQETPVLVDNGELVTDQNGMITLNYGTNYSGDLTFQEISLTGYNLIDQPITFGIDSNFKLYLKGTAPEGVTFNSESSTLTVLNESKSTSFKVKKDWPNEDEAKEVEMWLVRDGIPMQEDEYHVVLNKRNNWEYTWENLPLYVGGEPVKYSVFERRIGDVFNDPNADDDGYIDYTVNIGQLIYHFKDGTTGTKLTEDKLDQIDYASIQVTNKVYRQQIIVYKVNENKEVLSGAKFGLYNENPRDNTSAAPFAEAISNERGEVIFDNMPIGTYYMKELEAPSGYTCEDRVFKIVVERTGIQVSSVDPVTQQPSDSDDYISYEQGSKLIPNISTPSGSIEIQKYDFTNKNVKLEGATFQLYYWNETTGKYVPIGEDGKPSGVDRVVIETDAVVTTNNQGYVKYEGLAEGQYKIVETEAPQGYMLTSVEIEFNITRAGEVEMITDLSSNDMVEGYEPDSDSGMKYGLKVYNKTGTSLPKTGGIGTFGFTLMGMILSLLTVIAFVLINQRKRVIR